MGIHPPLSLVKDLLNLIGGRVLEGPLRDLARDKNEGMRSLNRLGWPIPARIGLVALLLHGIPLRDWAPPADSAPAEVQRDLKIALGGGDIEADPPFPPMVHLTESLKRVDNRLLSMLTMLGPVEAAKDPALPLRMLPKVKKLPAMTVMKRSLLGVRVWSGGAYGRSIGRGAGSGRGPVGGVETSGVRTDWASVLPSQFALPKKVFAYKYAKGELLFRAREVAEPPQLRPTVILLDVSPPAFGPVEGITRLAAHMVGSTLMEARVPVTLVTCGDNTEYITELSRPSDMLEIWTRRTLAMIDQSRFLKVASAVRANMVESSGPEPIILLLTHPWFCADYEPPEVEALRGLFVEYPDCPVKPVLAPLCEKWISLEPGRTKGLDDTLGRLIG
jgi:ATP-dependent Clp protease ATP-binding subunit ClpC